MMATPFMNMIFTLYTVYFIYVIIGVQIYGGKISGEMYQRMNKINPDLIANDYVWI